MDNYLRRHLPKHAGLSLIELMIAITIGLTLIAGVVQIFGSSKATYRTQEALSRVSENARFAIHFLSQDLSLAGFWGCNNNGANVISQLNPDVTGTINFAGGGLTGADGGIGGNDTITIRGLSGQPIPVASVASVSYEVQLDSATTLANNSILAISDCQNTDIFQLTQDVNNGTTLTHTAGAGQPGNASARFSRDDYAGNSFSQAVMYRADQITYTVAPDPNNNNLPTLFRNRNNNNIPLVEGVNGLQILYGEDQTGDGVVDRYVQAGTAGLNMVNVVAIQVSLTLISPQTNITPMQDNLDTTASNRLVRNFQATIAVRNRIPIRFT